MNLTSLSLLAHSPFRLDWRPDGWLHLVLGAKDDVLRGPAGSLGYLLFIPLLWLMPRRTTAAFLTISSLAWALVTLGPAYVAWILLLTAGGWMAIHLATIGPFSLAVRPYIPRTIAAMLLTVAYAALLMWPQPFPLPHVEQPFYFYLHWAGIGYIFLKLYHLVVDISAGRLTRPAFGDYAAYMLFAPTLRMGPIYRAGDFLTQLNQRPDRLDPAQIAPAVGRLFTGLLRWGVVMQLMAFFPADVVFGKPETLPAWKLIAGIYAQPFSIFLWISGNADIAIGLGRLMGFTIPDNFNYPWISTSLRTFWQRWHITLGLWLRDYLYIPLGGSRRHVFVNYLVTFGFCGLWHGLYPSYFGWGISQAFGLYINRRWNLFWKAQRERNTPICGLARRLRLIDTPLATALAWLVTFHYQILTIAWFMDETHTGRVIIPAILNYLT